MASELSSDTRNYATANSSNLFNQPSIFVDRFADRADCTHALPLLVPVTDLVLFLSFPHEESSPGLCVSDAGARTSLSPTLTPLIVPPSATLAARVAHPCAPVLHLASRLCAPLASPSNLLLRPRLRRRDTVLDSPRGIARLRPWPPPLGDSHQLLEVPCRRGFMRRGARVGQDGAGRCWTPTEQTHASKPPCSPQPLRGVDVAPTTLCRTPQPPGLAADGMVRLPFACAVVDDAVDSPPVTR
ncbi:hypothetical protein B0H19DRAFT_1250625 [Mycena capillaripes]|nr:hypothetical protein B0H19DRAFT_1250625 [Mycena capillaripes]